MGIARNGSGWDIACQLSQEWQSIRSVELKDAKEDTVAFFDLETASSPQTGGRCFGTSVVLILSSRLALA